MSEDERGSGRRGIWNERLERWSYAAAVTLGAVLAVATAFNQPYNQNEWAQVEPYDSWDPSVVTSGTRQPPLDPLLGALAQHAFGVGQLQQRLVPVACGIGALVLVALLLRRFRLGPHGVVALFFMATAPVFLRYAAYARPYALPMLLMLLCAYAGTRWLDTGRRRWLVVACAAAVLLPLSRVPEPVAFLASAAGLLALAGWRAWLPRARAALLAAGFSLAVATIGAFAVLRLGGETVIDLDPGRALDRLPAGLEELWGFVLPMFGEWFPWWPLTLVVVTLALLLPTSRRHLTREPGAAWYWLPLVVGPLAFLVAYHTVNPYPLEQRHYRIRFAYFFVPPLTVLVALASEAVSRTVRRSRGWWGPALAGVLLVSQLPMTWQVLTRNDTVDVGGAAALIEREVPSEAMVLYDGPAPAGYWRQPFFGLSRYFDDDAHARVLGNTTKLAAGGVVVGDAAGGPVYLLLIDAECVSTVACDGPDPGWDGEVAGFRKIERYDRFTLYEPTAGQAGREGLIDALLALSDAYGPAYAVRNLAAAARLLDDAGRRRQAGELLAEACANQPEGWVTDCRRELAKLDPLRPRSRP